LRGFCEFSGRKRRPQRGLNTSDVQIAKLLLIYESQTSTSTRIHNFGCPECEASANLGVANVDLNEDRPLRVHRMRGFCEFTSHKCRPQRGCTTSDAQIGKPERGLPRIRPKSESCSKRNHKKLVVFEVCHKTEFLDPRNGVCPPRDLRHKASTRIHHFGCLDCRLLGGI
jgi:hypothetical protein